MKIVKNVALAVALIVGTFTLPNQLKLDNALVFAASDGDTKRMRDLLTQGANPGSGALMIVLLRASPKNKYNIDQVVLLACAGADPDDFFIQKHLEEAGDPAQFVFYTAVKERAKNSGDCRKCEESCAEELFKIISGNASKKGLTK